MCKKILCYCLGLILAGMASLAWGTGGPVMGGASFQDQFREVKRTQMGQTVGVSQQTVDQLLQIEARYQPMRQQLIRE